MVWYSVSNATSLKWVFVGWDVYTFKNKNEQNIQNIQTYLQQIVFLIKNGLITLFATIWLKTTTTEQVVDQSRIKQLWRCTNSILEAQLYDL